MSQQHQMAMGGVGGPVGGPAAPGTPSNSATFSPDAIIKKLNTAIYDYLLCNEKYEVARVFHKSMRDEIEYATEIKHSPNQRQNQPNGIDSGMDVDSKEHPGIQKRPSDLPPPHSLSSEDSPFLQDWWCQFWELYQGNRQKGKPTTLSYVGTQRQAMKQRTGMVGGVDTSGMRPGYNGMMNGAGDLRAQAMKNGMTQQQMQQQQAMQMKRAQQGQQTPASGGEGMQRQSSQMSGSPNTAGGDAPSPKRQRVDGGGPQVNQQQQQQQRPGQPGQVLGNQSVEVYSQAMQQQMQKAMQTTAGSLLNANKGMPQTPSMGPGGAQSSPMAGQGMDGNNGEYQYNQRMGMPPNGAAQPAQASSNGNHALQDYQMQLMLLEQQNKKRLLMARQEQDSMAHPPNGGRGSPQPGMMDPNNQMRGQVMGPNGQPMMRPPSSHPMGQMGPMNPQQMEMMRQQQQQQQQQQQGQMMNGQFAGQPPPGQMMQGQQPPQGGPPGQPPNMTPRPGNMAPPPAPANAQGGTQPSSPAQPPAPPTPSQANKPKPGAKKGDNKKGAANQKKGADNANEAAQPTPTPPPPVTPSNAASFQQNKNLQNGQPQGQPLQQGQQQNTGQGPGPDINAPFGDLSNGEGFNTLDFANLDSGDVLDNFDFDSFLNSGDGGGDGLVGFDAQFAFGDALEGDMTAN